MSIYKPEHYTSSCIDSKNILSLCYKKYLGNNIISIIDSFLIEYATGFALFNNKNYIIDGKFIHKNNGGHALEPFII